MARRVIRVPDEDGRDAAVQPRGHEHRHAVLDSGAVDVCDGGVAGDGDGQGEEDEDAAEVQAVGEDGDEDWTA